MEQQPDITCRFTGGRFGDSCFRGGEEGKETELFFFCWRV